MSDVLEDLSRRAAQTQVWVDPTRSKPPPWFVGNGRGLMVAVLLVIAALVLARVVSTIWLVEAAWTWSHERFGRQDAVRPPAPHGPIAIDLQSWVTQADYPVEDEYARREGTTIVELGVDPSGRLTNCWIEGTSGSGYLDHAACDAIEARARFLPARDDKGDAVAALEEPVQMEDERPTIGRHRLGVRGRLHEAAQRSVVLEDAGNEDALGHAKCGLE